MNLDTRAIDKLFLELSQFTNATTARELELLERIRKLDCQHPQPVAEGPTDDEIEEWADACPETPLEEMDPDIHGWRRCFTAKEFSETIRAALAHWGQS